MAMDHLKKHIREVPDFPIEGILFYDITTLLENPAVFNEVIEALCKFYPCARTDECWLCFGR